MGNGMNKVLPGLYLGNFVGRSSPWSILVALLCTFPSSAMSFLRYDDRNYAKDFDQLSRNNITHILSIHESPQPYIPGITYLRIALPDTPEANIKKHFKECIHFIHSCRLRGGNCLVHCLAGISRSTTIVLVYVMAVTQLKWHEALEAVKAVRPVANPNPGFRQQLEEYGKSKSAQKIRRQLARKHGASPFNDEEAIQGLLPAGERPNPDVPRRILAPKSRGAMPTGPFLQRVKETFSCLPGCLK